MHELSIYDTREVVYRDFKPWMIGRALEVMVVFDDNNKYSMKFQGVLEWSSQDSTNWVFKFEGREYREVPFVRNERRRHVEISVVLPANYMHVNADGTNTGDTDGF